MHKSLLINVFCFFYFTLNAQVSFNVAEHIRDNKTSNLVECFGSLYFTHYSKGDNMGDQLYFCSYGKNGALRFKIGISIQEVFDERSKIIVTSDNKLAVVGWSSNCHVFSPIGYFYKFDTNGVVLLSNTFQNNLGFDSKFLDICCLANNYYVVSPNNLIELNSSGNVSNYSSLSSIISIDTTLSGKIVVNTQNFESKIFDAALNSLQSYTTTSNYFKYISKKESYYGLSNSGTIEKLDSVFLPIYTSFLAQQYSVGNRITDFTCVNDTIYAIGNNITAGSFYLKLDTNLQAISLLTNSTKNLIPAGITNIDNYCYTLNNNIGNSANPTSFYSLCGFKSDSIYHFKSSVALTSMALDTYSLYLTNGFIGPANGIDFTAKFSVKNTGSNVLNSFKLNTRLTDGMGNCNKTKYNQLFSGLNLLPNSSATFTTSLITTLMTGLATISPANLYQCFYTTVPNNNNDVNVNDDGFCMSISLPVPYLGFNDISKEDLNIILYPNPANENIAIEFLNIMDNENSKIQIVNNLGQIISEENSISHKKNTINTTNLNNGIYFINLLSDKIGTISKKFIVSH